MRGAEVPQLTVRFHAVGTPEFLGPPKIGEAQFVPPVAEEIHMPQRAACISKEAVGSFEAFVDIDGKVTSIHSHYEPVDGTLCQREHLFPAIRKWRFKPATFQGRPTPVYMWIGLDG